MDYDEPTLHDELLQSIEEKSDQEDFVKSVEKLAKTYGPDTYVELISILASVKLQQNEAEVLWRSAWIHRQSLSKQLDRPVNMIVALLDFVMMHREYLSQPKVIDVMEYERVAQSAIRDGLTGIYNPGYIREQVEWEIMKDRRYKRGGTIIIFDLNKFKQCNDEYGHLAGDAVLREFAALLRQYTRQSDAVGRYGGDEFLVLMPATDLSGAFIVADRIRGAFEETTVHVPTAPPEGISITTTGGIAQYKGEPELTLESLIESADQALYMGKREGANRIYIETLTQENELSVPADLIRSVSTVEISDPEQLKPIGRRRIQTHIPVPVEPHQIIDCTLVLPKSKTQVLLRGQVHTTTPEKKTHVVVFQPVERDTLDWQNLNHLVLQLEHD